MQWPHWYMERRSVTRPRWFAIFSSSSSAECLPSIRLLTKVRYFISGAAILRPYRDLSLTSYSSLKSKDKDGEYKWSSFSKVYFISPVRFVCPSQWNHVSSRVQFWWSAYLTCSVRYRSNENEAYQRIHQSITAMPTWTVTLNVRYNSPDVFNGNKLLVNK